MSVINRLRTFYIAILAGSVIIAIVYETDIATVGALDASPVVYYAIEFICVAVALLFIPLALKLLTFKSIRQRIMRSERDYERWSILRLALLATVLILNTSQYYMLDLDTTCSYLALMTAVTFLFVWPSAERMNNERNPMQP